MLGIGIRKKPEDVFTPRAATVNEAMYVARPDLEGEIEKALRTNQHFVIHGESGCGKSWLYKKVLDENKIKMTVVNMANASRFNDLNKAFEDAVSNKEIATKIGYSDVAEGEGSAVIAKLKMAHTDIYISIK